MSFDIYGQHLRPGHCEVHPDVHSEYPCPYCLEEYDRTQQRKREENQYYSQMEDAYYAQLMGEEEYQSWFKP